MSLASAAPKTLWVYQEHLMLLIFVMFPYNSPSVCHCLCRVRAPCADCLTHPGTAGSCHWGCPNLRATPHPLRGDSVHQVVISEGVKYLRVYPRALWICLDVGDTDWLMSLPIF